MEQARYGNEDQESVARLISGLLEDAQRLLRSEVSLAKEELRAEVGKLQQSAVALGGGGVLLALGGLLLLLMLVHLVADSFKLRLWASYLIVGSIFALTGAFLLQRGREQLQTLDPLPRQTIASVRRDLDTLGR